LAHRHLLELKKKTLKGDDEPRSSLSSFAIEEKQSTMTMSLPACHCFLQLKEKELKNDDKPGGLSLSLAT
jgi:hypothetical protein